MNNRLNRPRLINHRANRLKTANRIREAIVIGGERKISVAKIHSFQFGYYDMNSGHIYHRNELILLDNPEEGD